jgi:tetratricopeptide (TPR) repeat protein
MSNGISHELLQGAKMHQDKAFREAEAIYLDVLAQNPQDSDAHHLLSMLEFDLQNYAQSLEYAHKAIAINPTVSHYYVSLAQALEKTGDLENALLAYMQALKLDPYQIDAYFSAASLYIASMRTDVAIALYEQAFSLFPDDLELLITLAKVYHYEQNLAKATELYEKALQIKPDLIEALSGLSETALAQGDIKKALINLTYASKISQDPELINYLAKLYVQIGLVEKGIEVYNEYLQESPNNAEGCFNFANFLYHQNQIEEALTWYLKSFELAPPLPEARQKWVNRGIQLLQFGMKTVRRFKEMSLKPFSNNAIQSLVTDKDATQECTPHA